MMACNCIRLVNEAFERDGLNSVLQPDWIVNFETGERSMRIPIPVAKRDSKRREKARLVIAQFCPLCGASYAEPADE